MKSFAFLCFLGIATAMDAETSGLNGFARQIRCSGCGGGSSSGGGNRRSDSNGVSLRELIQLLPFLSTLNSAPVAGATITHLPYPPVLGLSANPLAPGANANPNAGAIGAIATLARVLTRRQAGKQISTDEARSRLANAIAAATEAVIVQNASVSGRVSSGHKVNGEHFVPGHFNGSVPRVSFSDEYEFEDYGPPPAPAQLSKYTMKGRIGSSCQNDTDCVRGASCQSRAADTNGEKVCQCRLPFVISRGRCVPIIPVRKLVPVV